MSDIFLSYSSQDRGTAASLADALERHGWSVWWDRRIPTGRDYADVIESELTSARCVVVLWSQASVASEWVKTEAADAKDRRLLVPVLIEPVKIPLEFRRVQAADLTDWGGEVTHPGFSTLVGDLSGRLGAPDAASSRPTPEAEADFSGEPPRPRARTDGDGRETKPLPRRTQGRALLLLGGAAMCLVLVSVGIVWSGALKSLIDNRNERAADDGGGVATQNSSPTPPTSGATPAGNTRPSPTPTPDAGANRGGNVNGGGGENIANVATIPPDHLNSIRRLFATLDSPDERTSGAALSGLIAKHASDPVAVGEALNRLEARRVKTLSLDGIKNVFFYLNQTQDSAWTPELRARAPGQFRHLDEVEMDGVGLTQYGIYKKRIKGLTSAR